MRVGKHYLRMAVQSNDANCLRSIHLFLNQMYYLMLYGDEKNRFITETNFKKLSIVQREWIRYEENKIKKKYDVHKPVDFESVEDAYQQSDVYYHPWYAYLEKKADKNDFRWFVLNESVLNLEFFDYLSLSIIGVNDEAKAEIARNMWDEAGCGNMTEFHTTLFRSLLDDLKLQYNRDLIVANMPWQGLAGINLFSYYAIYPYNKMRLFGLMAATEMCDPLHYHSFIKGFKRVFSESSIRLDYYTEHETIDVLHASGWIRSVILPALYEHPEKQADFWIGFYMRLEYLKRYYDYFYHAIEHLIAA